MEITAGKFDGVLERISAIQAECEKKRPATKDPPKKKRISPSRSLNEGASVTREAVL